MPNLNLRRVGRSLLKDAAAKRRAEYLADKLNRWDETLLTYNAGWERGEWTCCHCGRMFGKNLNGDSPFLLAREHSAECDNIVPRIPLH